MYVLYVNNVNVYSGTSYIQVYDFMISHYNSCTSSCMIVKILFYNVAIFKRKAKGKRGKSF
jgi:hypothetical protein